MNILLVDDHALIREALRSVLKKLKPRPSLAEASTGDEAIRFVEQHPELDLVLFDLNLPDRDGFAVLTELRRRHPTIGVVVLSAIDDRLTVRRALDLGVLGFIPKTTEQQVMLHALQLIFSGGIYVPPEILGLTDANDCDNGSGRNIADRKLETLHELGLTRRQIDILLLLMEGKSNKAISSTLKMAEPTVKNHVTAVLKALKAANRTEAVVKIGKMGLQLPAARELSNNR